MGGVWEWTSTVLTPHDGFQPMALYPGYTGERARSPLPPCLRAWLTAGDGSRLLRREAQHRVGRIVGNAPAHRRPQELVRFVCPSPFPPLPLSRPEPQVAPLGRERRSACVAGIPLANTGPSLASTGTSGTTPTLGWGPDWFGMRRSPRFRRRRRRPSAQVPTPDPVDPTFSSECDSTSPSVTCDCSDGPRFCSVSSWRKSPCLAFWLGRRSALSKSMASRAGRCQIGTGGAHARFISPPYVLVTYRGSQLASYTLIQWALVDQSAVPVVLCKAPRCSPHRGEGDSCIL